MARPKAPVIQPWRRTELWEFIENRKGHPRLSIPFVQALRDRGFNTCDDLYRFVTSPSTSTEYLKRIGMKPSDARTVSGICNSVRVELMPIGTRLTIGEKPGVKMFNRQYDLSETDESFAKEFDAFSRLRAEDEIDFDAEKPEDPNAPRYGIYLADNDISAILSMIAGRRVPANIPPETVEALRVRLSAIKNRNFGNGVADIDPAFDAELEEIEWKEEIGGYRVRVPSSHFPEFMLVDVIHRWDATIRGVPVTIVLRDFHASDRPDGEHRPYFYLYRNLDNENCQFLAENNELPPLRVTALRKILESLPIVMAPGMANGAGGEKPSTTENLPTIFRP